MLSRLAKVLLVATAFAPVLLTYAFVYQARAGFSPIVASLLAVSAGLVLLCVLVVKAARTQLEVLDFEVTSLKTADMEIVGFVVAYLMPLVNSSSEQVDPLVLAFVLGVFFVVIWTTNSYHFNPLLGLLGFHFYEVANRGEVTYLLITRRDLRSTRSVSRVVQLTNYMVLDLTDR